MAYCISTINDDFTGSNGDAPNVYRWRVPLNDNNILQIQSNKLNYFSSSDNISRMQSYFRLTGNFSITLDFDLSQFVQPGVSGTHYAPELNLRQVDGDAEIEDPFTMTKIASVARSHSSGGVNGYESNSTSVAKQSYSQNDSSGKLRLVRENGTITAYVSGSGQWEWNGDTDGRQLATGYNSEVEVQIVYDQISTNTVQGTTDNFVVSGGAVWPTLCFNDDFTGSNGDPPNSVRWSEYGISPSATDSWTIQNNELDVSLSSGPKNVGIVSKNKLIGDFNIQIDWLNVVVGSDSDMRLLVGDAPSGGGVNEAAYIEIRRYFGTHEIAGDFKIGGIWQGEDSVDRYWQDGKLGIVRSGTSLTLRYQDHVSDSSWHDLATDTVSPSAMYVNLTAQINAFATFNGNFDDLVVINVDSFDGSASSSSVSSSSVSTSSSSVSSSSSSVSSSSNSSDSLSSSSFSISSSSVSSSSKSSSSYSIGPYWWGLGSEPSDQTGYTTASYTYIPDWDSDTIVGIPLFGEGWITKIQFHVHAGAFPVSAGKIDVAAFNWNTFNEFRDRNWIESIPVSATSGLVTLEASAGDFNAQFLPVSAGQLVGFTGAGSGLLIHRDNTASPGSWWDAGDQIGTGTKTFFTLSDPRQLQFRVYIERSISSSSSSSYSSSSSSSSSTCAILRITEEGVLRITEDGTKRITEDILDCSSCVPTVLEDIGLQSSSSSSSTTSSSSSSLSESSSSSSSSESSSSSSSSESSSSLSESSSSSSTTPGTVTWGHHTGVVENYNENYSGNWTVDDNATITGSGDSEELSLNCIVATSVSETWYLGAIEAKIVYDKYGTGSGDAPTIQYKTGTTRVNCEADTWHVYNGTSFTCTGWAKIKVIKT